MALANRFASFLDRFDSQLVVNGERMKHELNQWIDERVALVRTEVQMIRFGVIRPRKEKVFDDEPKVVTVSLDDWIKERGRAAEESSNAPSTSSAGHKRKSTVNQQSGSNNKRLKTTGSNRFVCKYPECGKTFPHDMLLVNHERVHLGVKPFLCTWPSCRYASEQRGNVIRHVRIQHFNLPITKKEQKNRNIADQRNSEDYVREDQDLMKRRLE